MDQPNTLLVSAAAEIRHLRNELAIKSARLEMFDQCMQLLHTQPYYGSNGVSPDIAWQIDRYIENGQAATPKDLVTN